MICDNVIFSEIEAKVRATDINAGWSSPVARQAHNLKVAGSNPAPATKFCLQLEVISFKQRNILNNQL